MTSPAGPAAPPYPATDRSLTVTLPADVWLPLAEAHAERADALTAAYTDRRARGERHAIDDFLYDYYGVRPARLRRWHPGTGRALAGTDEQTAAHAAWRWYRRADGVVTLDVGDYLAARGDTVGYLRGLLAATASRPAHVGCLGLHEWAMVYRQDDERRRHSLPLRLGRDGTDAVVESHPVRCSHFDAFRFFTPQAVGLNRLRPTRANQPAMEQPGCLHANMDLLKWALKLGPAAPGDLVLDCFALAREIRTLDMQASPYDVSSLGERAVAVETPAGRAEYVGRQRGFAERAAVLRERMLAVCDGLLGPQHAGVAPEVPVAGRPSPDVS